MSAACDFCQNSAATPANDTVLGYIKPGQTLDIRAGDGRLEIEVTATPMTLKKRGKDVVAVPDVKLPTLTADAVRETLEHMRR